MSVKDVPVRLRSSALIGFRLTFYNQSSIIPGMNVELHQRFLKNVRRRRLTLGLTQSQVADALGISQPGYAAIEAGRRNPSLDVVERVADALGCEAPDLLVAVTEEKILA